MNKILKMITLLSAATLLTTSCIDETFPESSTVTADQLAASADAFVASVNGISSQMSQWYYVYGEQEHETDMGYLMYLIADTELLGDMYPEGSNSGYDWFRAYNVCQGMGLQSYASYLSWFTSYKLIKAANDVISVVEDPESANDAMKTYLAEAYAYRALFYYQLMVHWEPVANEYTDCSEVLGLTVPIVTEKTTAEESMKNPRVSHEEMVKFIISDLELAEKYMVEGPANKNRPSLACVYGVRARVHMWDEDYENAAKYARMAINEHGADPMSETQWLDVNTGFNTAVGAWMWKCSYDAENMANLCNWTGWMASEADWGYSSLTCPAIDRSLYDHIAYTDFRKQAFLDPDRKKSDPKNPGHRLYEYKTCRPDVDTDGDGKTDSLWTDLQPNYLSLKFRCKGGNYETYTIGGLCDVPIMRVEEFYLLEAEAVARTKGLEEGRALLNDFVKTWRDAEYSCNAKDVDALAKEVLTQIRIEFWGEGIGFANAKRLRAGVMQNYAGTNAPADIFKLNCRGIKPNWNFVIPQYEIDSNSILGEQNNPDPSSVVKTPCKEGEYAVGAHAVE